MKQVQTDRFRICTPHPLNSALRHCNHLWRLVAGEYRYASLCEKTGIDPGSTAEFEYTLSAMKRLLQFLPSRRALRLANLRDRKGLVVTIGKGIERGSMVLELLH
jgi:hypothetical protein